MRHQLPKQLLTLLLIAIASVQLALAQTQTVKHTVQRGETLETIAKKYGVTKDDIVKLNPDAAQFVYVGMELTVPVNGNGMKPITEESKQIYTKNQMLTTQKEEETYNIKETESPINFSFKISYGFLRFGDDFEVRKSSFTYGLTAGIDYNFYDNWYMSANVGWKHYNINTTVKGEKSSGADIDCIVLPLTCGYSFDGIISPYVGIEFAYAIKGKTEYCGETMSKKVKDVTNSRFATTVSVGINIVKYVNIAYNYELTEMCGKKAQSRYFSIGLGMLF